MTSLISKFITGYDAGLQTNKKPYLLPDRAWQTLENAYVFRERVLKRQGLRFLGRLRRNLTATAMGNISAGAAGTFTFNIFTGLGLTNEPDAEIEPGNLTNITIVIAAPISQTLTDTLGTGVLTIAPIGVITQAILNYATGDLILTFSGAVAASATTFAGAYYPTLPVMGIPTREIAAINDEQTIWFDEKYAYVWSGTQFDEFITTAPNTWLSTDSDFFWAFNYQGATAADRLFFVTNFISNGNNPMRYTDGTTWTNFAPLVTALNTLFSARILIAYYGRLLALNTWEGLTAAGAGGATNFFNRCRFCQLGSPIAVDAWQTDIFGKGGVLDAPTNEAIIGARFIKNTLVVFFEKTTWQLRYVGEYGLPFIWERISADFGSESTFSNVLFDNHALAVGDKAIIAANAINAERIDLDIPDQIFQFKNVNNGTKRVQGIRDYQRELVFWNYPDAQTKAAPGVDLIFPNKVLIYNYRNNTWAIFRDSVTAFGTFQNSSNITWDNTNVFWDDEDTTWDDFDSQSLFPSIVIGNQQGYVHYYGYVTPDEQSLSIQAIDVTVTPIVITSPSHNLQPDEIIQITGMKFIQTGTTTTLTTTLNDGLYKVTPLTADTFSISQWQTSTQSYINNFSFSFTPFTPVGNVTYVGGGEITLFPKLNVKTKDINIFQDKGLQTKLSYLDFLMGVTASAAMSVNLFINSSTAVKGNLLVGNKNMNTSLAPSFYPPGSDYAWFRFYATLAAQYFNINITYNDDLMNTLATHKQGWTLYAINAWLKPGGKIPF